ncbi:MAG: sulfatase-like hydrolase/transferase [Kiritimatiellales bacterium]
MMTRTKTFFQYLSAGSVLFQVSGLASEQISCRPNVVFITSDQQRSDSCGAYNSPVRRKDGSSPTPFIDKLAAGGVRFDYAYCNSPLCAPSRASFMTGMYPHTTTAINHQPDRRNPGVTRFPGIRAGILTMGEVFRNSGYRTAAIGKMHVHGELKDVWDMGFDVTKLRFYTEFPGHHYADLRDGDVNARYRGIYNYKDKTLKDVDPERFKNAPEDLTVVQNDLNPYFLETLVEREEEMFDYMVTTESLKFIEESVQQNVPFFIHIGLEKPHPRWDTFQRFLDLFDPEKMPLPETRKEWREKGMLPTHLEWIHNGMADDKIKNAMAAYYACVASLDEQVGRITDLCAELDIDENTIFVFTSDHGEMLFDHGIRGKHNMYEESVRVPLIVKYSQAFKQGSQCSVPVGLIDIFPTFAELCGFTPPSLLEGVSLLSVIKGDGTSQPVFSEFYETGYMGWRDRYAPVRMCITDQYKYVYTHGCIDQLFDRVKDPQEMENLAVDSAYNETRRRLKFITLESWELDSYPQLEIQAAAGDKHITLSWQPAGEGAVYTLFRSDSPDVSDAVPVGKNIRQLTYTDSSVHAGAHYSYWVMADVPLTRAFTDKFGKQRYGITPVLTAEYPRVLPASGRVDIQAAPGEIQTKKYVPWNGGTFEEIDWIWTGYPLNAADGIGICSGSSFILTQQSMDGDHFFDAMIRTVKNGQKAWERGSIIFNYTDYDHYYRLTLKANGRLALEKTAGFWKPAELLYEHPEPGGNPAEWNRIRVEVRGKQIAVSCNEKPVFVYQDQDMLRSGRSGFCAGVGMQCEFKDITVSE